MFMGDFSYFYWSSILNKSSEIGKILYGLYATTPLRIVD
jgi:hypothetical protein